MSTPPAGGRAPGDARHDPREGAGQIVRVAVPSPLRRSFDYRLEPGAPRPVPGARLRVPFGRGTRIGIVLELVSHSDVPPEKLRAPIEILDREPALPPDTLELLGWAGAYFHHPIGEVMTGALPGPLRQGRETDAADEPVWALTSKGLSASPEDLARAPRQAAVLAQLGRAAPDPLGAAELGHDGGAWREALRALERRGWVERRRVAKLDAAACPGESHRVELNTAQLEAVTGIARCQDRFEAFLLDGVTGSGKTEVYLHLIEETVARGLQVLVLIPEIGLTPQAVRRFRRGLDVRIALTHSGLPDGQRLAAWQAARTGTADVVIGTRSAVFTPLARPGLVVVDEEHDPSYKQQDGFRYSARDLAVLRAKRWDVPVVLGTATPSLETLYNVQQGRYREVRLPARAGAAEPPTVEVVDLRGRRFEEGLSSPLMRALEETCERGEQALLFLNRRGYAPMLLCNACGWLAECDRCDAKLVLYRDQHLLRCQHCAAERRVPERCPECGAGDPRALGLGTQRVVDALRARAPDLRVDRMDRDSTRRRGSLESVLDRVHRGETDVLVGTQMLAKGHHFPRVTLVGILDADSGLFGVDFRASERMAQLLVQVAGRAGRAEHRGRVLVQTHHPDHPLLACLIRQGYRAFAQAALAEREAARLPPWTAAALLRAEAARPEQAHQFLHEARAAAETAPDSGVRLSGPVPAPMERRAGRHRAQLLLEADTRAVLQRLLGGWVESLESMRSARRVRWSLDVDPQEML